MKGKFNPCEDCALGKARQSNVSKKADPRSPNKREQLFIDISSPSTKSTGRRKHWLLIVHDYTNYCWEYFLKEKSDLKSHVIELIKELDSKYNYKVKSIHCDNVGDNTSFEKACKQEDLVVFFEYTAPGTLQQNERVERKFATLYNRVRAMQNGGKFTYSVRNQLLEEAAQTGSWKSVTDQSGVSTWNSESISPFWGKGKQASWIQFKDLVKLVLLQTGVPIMNKL